MRWLTISSEVEDAREVARWCDAVETGREPSGLRPTVFQDIDGMGDKFFPLIRAMTMLSGDNSFTFIVTEPDPEYYWFDRFGTYGCFDVGVADTADQYIGFLGKPVGRSGWSLNSLWFTYVIFPGPAARAGPRGWFARATRSGRDDSGRLWLPPAWVPEAKALFPWLGDLPTDCKGRERKGR